VLLDQAIADLFARERDLLFERLSSLSAADLASIIERALPILADCLGKMHTQKARDLLLLAPFAFARSGAA
jgi:hypothetical protein